MILIILYQIRLNSYRLVNFLGVKSRRGDFLRNAVQIANRPYKNN